MMLDEGLLLSDRLAQRIRELVISGDLSPGQRLSEATFSENFEVSRNSLREAFRLLTKDGLLKHETNRGVFVAVPTTASILDIYRVRRLVECASIKRAWQGHPALRAMRGAVETAFSLREAMNWRGVGSANMAFHAAIVDLADSPRLSEFFKRISAELRLGFGLLNDPEQIHAPFVNMNADMLHLLEAGDLPTAVDAMETYLDVSERAVLKALSADDRMVEQ